MRSRISHYAVLAGLSALVPLPFLDLWCERRALRLLYAEVAAAHARPLPPEALDALVADRGNPALGCLLGLLAWPVKKLFRTVLYFLTIKDVVDGVAAASLRAAMVHAALPHLPDRAHAVRDAMEATLDRFAHSPVRRLLFRDARPHVEWLVAGEPVVGALFRHAGAGILLPDFQSRLEGPP